MRADGARPRRSSPEPCVAADRAIRDARSSSHGVDLGPALAARVVGAGGPLHAAQDPGRRAASARCSAAFDPAGILLADEYHRQDWLTAAAAEGVPVAAIQHGMIYRGHNGYIHRDAAATLRLPDRTYVFGDWERAVLIDDSVYRDDEVRGRRLAAAGPRPTRRRTGCRAASARSSASRPATGWSCCPARTDRSYRRFHYPVALAGCSTGRCRASTWS